MCNVYAMSLSFRDPVGPLHCHQSARFLLNTSPSSPQIRGLQFFSSASNLYLTRMLSFCMFCWTGLANQWSSKTISLALTEIGLILPADTYWRYNYWAEHLMVKYNQLRIQDIVSTWDCSRTITHIWSWVRTTTQAVTSTISNSFIITYFTLDNCKQ